MADGREVLGLIAGNRDLPLEFARLVRQSGRYQLVAVAFEGETDRRICDLADHVDWIRVGQLGRMIKAFKAAGVSRCVMLGQISPKNLFDMRPDLRALAVLLRLKERNAHTIFGAVAEELRKDGIELVDPTPWLKPLMPGPGFSLGPRPTPTQKADVQFGFRIAKEVARLEIGQTVVVKHGTVLAVEAFEGTDRCLARGGELAGPRAGAVAVKVSKPGHDMRFDIPCIGPSTIEVCANAGVAVLAFEAGRTLILNMSRVRNMCDQLMVSLLAVS